MLANTKARMDEIVSDNLDPPPLMPCIHHWIIQGQHDGQSLGICEKCDEHKVFAPSFVFGRFIHKLKPD